MALKNYTGESGAGSAKTHTLDIPAGAVIANFQSLTISVRGADLSADVSISIVDDGVTRWNAYLRNGTAAATTKTVWEFHPGEIIIRGNTLTITTGAGGAGAVLVVSAVYNAYQNKLLGS